MCYIVLLNFFFYFAICCLCIKCLFAVVFSDVIGVGIINIFRRQCHVEVQA